MVWWCSRLFLVLDDPFWSTKDVNISHWTDNWKHLLCEAPLTSGTAQDHCPYGVRCPYVRCPRFWWFLRSVQACVTGSYPPRQFFRNLSTVYFSNPHKQRLANDGSIFGPLFEQKSEKKLQKSTPIYWCRKWSKRSQNALRATCPAGCYLVINLFIVSSSNLHNTKVKKYTQCHVTCQNLTRHTENQSGNRNPRNKIDHVLFSPNRTYH